MPRFYAHSARPFVASLRHVAHAGPLRGGRRPRAPAAREGDGRGAASDLPALGPWAGRARRLDARGRGEGPRRVDARPLEPGRERPRALARGPRAATRRSSARSSTGSRASRAPRAAPGSRRAAAGPSRSRSRRGCAAPRSSSPRPPRPPAPKPGSACATRIVLLGEPIAAVVALAAQRPDLADAPALLAVRASSTTSATARRRRLPLGVPRRLACACRLSRLRPHPATACRRTPRRGCGRCRGREGRRTRRP